MDESIRRDAKWYYFTKYQYRTAFNPYHSRNGGIRKAIDKHTDFLELYKVVNQEKWCTDRNIRNIIFRNNTLSIEVFFDDLDGNSAYELLIDYPEDDEIGNHEDCEFKTFLEWFDWKLNDDYEGIYDLVGDNIFDHLGLDVNDMKTLDITLIEDSREQVMYSHKLNLLVHDSFFDRDLRDEFNKMVAEDK